MNDVFMNMINSVDDIIKRKRYLKDLQKVIPYCKQCLLENEVPYVNSILDNPPFIIDTVRNNSISYIMEPCDSNYKKIKFYYALISGLVEVDRLGYAIRLNSEYIRGTVHYNTIYNTLVELQEYPEEFKMSYHYKDFIEYANFLFSSKLFGLKIPFLTASLYKS